MTPNTDDSSFVRGCLFAAMFSLVFWLTFTLLVVWLWAR